MCEALVVVAVVDTLRAEHEGPIVEELDRVVAELERLAGGRVKEPGRP